jgi:L-asparaginase/Glu-tRNA(Gln) amidotransferase subunit D
MLVIDALLTASSDATQILIHSIAHARKAATSAIDAFRSFPRGPLARVTPSGIDWFAPPHRLGAAARYPFPAELPRVAKRRAACVL